MKRKDYRLFFSILKENLTDIEALHGIKIFLSELRAFSRFIFCFIIIFGIGYIGLFAYNIFTKASTTQTIFTGCIWGFFGLTVTETYFRMRKRKLNRMIKKIKEAKENAA
jgi:hypothetical protein